MTPSDKPPETVGDALARQVEARRGPASPWAGPLRELGAVDRAVYEAAFAFAYAVGRNLPGLAVPIRVLAAAVAYSRVHTGVHYPGDVAAGSVVGAGTAAMVAAAFERLTRWAGRRRRA